MIATHIEGQAGWVTLSRPEKRNALNIDMALGLLDALAALDRDGEVRCIVLAADGPVFCAGADIREAPRADGAKGIHRYADIVTAILSCGKPVIARVQGPAVAGGVGLVAACHLAVAADAATFLVPELGGGLFPLMVYTLVGERVGRKLSLEMALAGRTLAAAEARDAGIVNAVVPAARLDETIGGWVAAVAKNDGDVLRRGLEAVRNVHVQPLVERLRACQQIIDRMDSRRPPR